jgi:hypothetical protein
MAILAGIAMLQRVRAMVGGAPIAGTEYGRSVVMILGSSGTSGTACTATVIGRDLLLTAAHCVQPGSDYRLVGSEPGQSPVLKAIARIERHPQFEIKRFFNHLATADIALIKLAEPLPPRVAPARIGGGTDLVSVGDTRANGSNAAGELSRLDCRHRAKARHNAPALALHAHSLKQTARGGEADHAADAPQLQANCKTQSQGRSPPQ